jgi:hypothetical protein
VRRTITFVLACAVAMTLPAASGMANNHAKGEVNRLAAKQCQGERNTDRAAFRSAYGRPAIGNCIRENRPEIRSERREAIGECKAEREAGIDAFRNEYGTNSPRGENAQGTNRNAFGVCVRSKVRAEIRENVAEFRNAAQACRSERAEDGDEFRKTYGTNSPAGEKARGGQRNAFGKCVVTKLREAEDENGNDENGA